MKFFRFFFCLLFLTISVLIPEAEAAQKKGIRSSTIAGRRYVVLADVAKHYGLKMSVRSKDIVLYSKYTRVVFNQKKRAGSFNGVNLTWFYAPFKRGNVFYISEQDLFLLLDPLIRRKSLPKRPVRTIMIDAGHGGKDTGAIGTNKKKEKDITLAIALKLRYKLIRLGYKVRLTRSNDSFPSLERRVVLWKNARPKPDLYISIHCNAAGNPTVSGIETFAVTPANAPSTADAKPSATVYPGNACNKYNTRLAYDIQKAMVKYFPNTPDRGVKHARFYVIRNVNCPAVLIETGFLSNKQECALLSSDAYQNRMANAILYGILTYSAKVR